MAGTGVPVGISHNDEVPTDLAGDDVESISPNNPGVFQQPLG